MSDNDTVPSVCDKVGYHCSCHHDEGYPCCYCGEVDGDDEDASGTTDSQ